MGESLEWKADKLKSVFIVLDMLQPFKQWNMSPEAF